MTTSLNGSDAKIHRDFSSFCFTLNQETETKLLKTARGIRRRIQEESSRSSSLSFLFLDFV